MWKPRDRFYPCTNDGYIMITTLAPNEKGEVLEFAGLLRGENRYGASVERMILAWRRNTEEKNFMVYEWSGGHQGRIGTVKVSDVVGLDTD